MRAVACFVAGAWLCVLQAQIRKADVGLCVPLKFWQSPEQSNPKCGFLDIAAGHVGPHCTHPRISTCIPRMAKTQLMDDDNF